MRILVLGASGASGLAFIQEVVAHNDLELVLYVRSPSKIPDEFTSSSKVKVVTGQLNDSKALSDALEGVDAVVSFLGPGPSFASVGHAIFRMPPTPIADAFPALFEAMRMKGVKRILALSTPSYLLSGERIGPYWAGIITGIWAIAPQGRAEMRGIAQHMLVQDDLDWTVFRVPVLTNGSGDLPVSAGFLSSSDYAGGGWSLSRASLAKWVIEEVKSPKWIKQLPALSNK